MVYDWEDKEDICYKMYIEEKKSLEEIMEYMKKEHKFAPSKRAFQTQFKRWDFPSKQHPAHKNAALVQRIKELWDCNTSQREMLRILNEEGHEIKERELMRVRAKNRWLLRIPNGMKNNKKAASDQDIISQLQASLYPDGGQLADVEGDDENIEGLSIQMPVRATRAESPPLSPEVLQKRQERLAKLQAESAERWATRKRRRRTRGWAGLPADPPGPPRFPSETTIDESKTYLSLDPDLYRLVRDKFQEICEQEGIIKKTIAGPEKWESAKSRLVQETPHLQTVIWGNLENQEHKKLSLDVICGDVTKRMRTMERRMTIAEAKNALGVNPEESRQLRNAFYQVLKADHFTSKLEAGDEHWKELKAQWINGSELLQNIMAQGDADPQHEHKVKAMEVLCRDVMKRLRDDQTKRDPTRKKKLESTFVEAGSQVQQPLPQVGLPQFDPTQDIPFQPSSHHNLVQTATRAQAQSQASQNQVQRAQTRQIQQIPPHPQVMIGHDNMQIDPNLLAIASVNDQGLGIGRGMQYAPYGQQSPTQGFASHQAYQTSPATIAVYFRLHQDSDFSPSSRMWMSTLSLISVGELREVACSKFPGTLTLRIEGVIKQQSGHEITIPIDQDDELEAYLSAINHVKPTFQVQLVTAWKA
ncbi:hypothetical protein B0O99DRAFT_508289 [Bisporella sp. PMI_857]|nr:hypothetical protein B0O99DRAFT_508289 [Bisporella sp. PMI_857]